MNPEKKLEDYLDRLIRRRNFLSNRVENSGQHLSYDEAELAALTWVITLLHEKQAVVLDHLELYLKGEPRNEKSI